MQTFLPYSNYVESAKCLDYRRLGKQRVECLQILQTLTEKKEAWSNHPAVKMWTGYEYELCIYGLIICQEWLSRGYKDTCFEKISEISKKTKPSGNPPFMGNQAFHDSHKSNLLRKNPEYYGQFNWSVSNDIEYVWEV